MLNAEQNKTKQKKTNTGDDMGTKHKQKKDEHLERQTTTKQNKQTKRT